MILTLALRSLLSRPVRSAGIAGGFGLGVAVMAALLGIGGVILDQARAPALVGGGDVVIGNRTGRVGSARFVLADVLSGGSLGNRVKVASPTSRASLYLVDDRGLAPLVIAAESRVWKELWATRKRAACPHGSDTPADREWVAPTRADVLRDID